jgi:hypothetical protein
MVGAMESWQNQPRGGLPLSRNSLCLDGCDARVVVSVEGFEGGVEGFSVVLGLLLECHGVDDVAGIGKLDLKLKKRSLFWLGWTKDGKTICQMFWKVAKTVTKQKKRSQNMTTKAHFQSPKDLHRWSNYFWNLKSAYNDNRTKKQGKW